MKAAARWIITLATCWTVNVAHADTVLDWNKLAIDAVVAAKQPPPVTTRSMAIVHCAMHDAVSAIEGRYATYRPTARAPTSASADAAAAGAAHAVLVRLFPDQKRAFDAALAAALIDSMGTAEEREVGVAFGATVGAELFAARVEDGTAASGPYRPLAIPGRYTGTALPAFGAWAGAKPFVMARPDQFRPGPPPALTSAQWAADYNEIKSMGGKASASRSKEQTEIAQFWIVTGAPAYNSIVRELAGRGARTLSQNARLFALVYLGLADSLVAVFDAKYAYEFWRPMTAIRNGDLDGNDATPVDLAWMPLVENPPHPEYPCAHCINAATAVAVLESEFGNGTLESFSMVSPTLPNVVRTWTRLGDLVPEVSNARVWGGVHYRNSALVAEKMGRDIGEMTAREMLKPVK